MENEARSTAPDLPYDPWRDLAENWPGIEVVREPMPGRLLGELRVPVIALRAGTSAAQERCTLAHELVHLERGGGCGGPWAAREEMLVHAEAARRLVTLDALADAIAEIGGDHDVGALARLLDVDTETARLRLRLLDAAERARLRAGLNPQTWVA
ncbi:MAG TPA: ImmA/IrrE family metallo-endopeptidase [Jatrophihabitantaceae bacterium]|nr:ImmA/IrrE family metallo-endopeptidase [Jatrophihabitantaceae bacterium]